MKAVSIFLTISGLALILVSLMCLMNCATVEAVNLMARMTIAGAFAVFFGLVFLAQNIILRRVRHED